MVELTVAVGRSIIGLAWWLIVTGVYVVIGFALGHILSRVL